MAEKIKETPIEEPPIKADPTPIRDANDFFAISSTDREKEMKNFIKELGAPKEKMDDVDMEFMNDPEETPGSSATPEMSEAEKEMAAHFDTSDGHKEMARIALMAVDKFLAFVASLFTGMEMDRYKRPKKPDEYEIEVTAAMMKKYEVSMSIEWMFAVAMIGAYSPAFQKAYADRKAMRAKKEQLRRQEELEILARNIKG